MFWQTVDIKRKKLEVIQINLGNKCNQTCKHCHIEASPSGDKNMDVFTAEKIIDKLINMPITKIEFTGGAPECNPNLEIFLEKLSKQGKDITVRTNLSILVDLEYSYYLDLYEKYEVKLVGSLPAVFEEIVDKQRGKGVFERSLEGLQSLNDRGLVVDLVYNPDSDFLPPSSCELEQKYKGILKDNYNLTFNSLIAITNVPIGNFAKDLKREFKYDNYLTLLKDHYNKETLANLMCRSFVSVDWQGNVYDCDFNLAMGKKVTDTKFWQIDFENWEEDIHFADYCYACTANRGSSCHGSLVEPQVIKNVKEYYGSTLDSKDDLKTDACCTAEEIPQYIKKALLKISDEIIMKYYGCGSPIPEDIKGLNALDIGCGTGRDVYIMSQLVGESGKVLGIDMTENQINVAKKYLPEQMKRFGFQTSNVEFIHDYVEKMSDYTTKESLDFITSNCVINLVEDKQDILTKIYDALKFGGEFYFSDVYVDRRNRDEIRKNPILYGECLGGALYYKDFEFFAKSAGFHDPRIMKAREIEITNPEVKALVGDTKFYSVTYRLWKLKGLEGSWEDYGQVATFKGDKSKDFFTLDGAHIFAKNVPIPVSGNTVQMIQGTRFSKFFEIEGSFKYHRGSFEGCRIDIKKSVNKASGCGC
ncbi:MAG: radical SAM/Cys-rich domain protein [bacterium]|nr:radical SAM/Cys-rich domain protein [bacterium]